MSLVRNRNLDTGQVFGVRRRQVADRQALAS